MGRATDKSQHETYSLRSISSFDRSTCTIGLSVRIKKSTTGIPFIRSRISLSMCQKWTLVLYEFMDEDDLEFGEFVTESRTLD